MTGQALSARMKAAGITQAQLAAYLGVSVHTVASWRQDRRFPCCQFMREAIARYLREKGK